jgi:hypothetical protein
MKTGSRVRMGQALHRALHQQRRRESGEAPTCELCGGDEVTPRTFVTVEGFLVCPGCSDSPKLQIMRKESDERHR